MNRDLPPVSVVGIGASAGGLTPLVCFLNALPKDFGFAVVFIQHLSTKHKSILPELLQNRRPDITTLDIMDGMEVLPGMLYICPPGKDVRILKGVFRITASPREHLHLAIDEFLTSLAEESGERATAVIFSGAGSDGARGARAIRDMGGTVFVQDPATAEFPSMPLAVIDSGQADTVLPPEEIAREVLKLHELRRGSDTFTPADFDAFYTVLQEKTGNRFNHYKQSVVSRRIRRRMYLRGVPSVKDYLDMLSSNDSETIALASDLMIGVTSFFRDALAWKALRIGVIRKIAARDNDSPLRVWTAACATGEEAYSIAMLLDQECELAGRKRDFMVFATDLNEHALEKARDGKYPGSITADVPHEYMRKYFASSEDGRTIIIDKAIREKVVFARQDLLTDPPFSRIDLILCRNFLIYLEPDAQEKCIVLFHYALKPGGHLFLGNAESVGRRSPLFKTLPHKKCRIFQKIDTIPSSRMPFAVPFAAERQTSVSARRPAAGESLKALTGMAQEALLEDYAPAAVAIDKNHNIFYHNGPTNRYLSQPRGLPTSNLLDLIPEGMRSRLRGALYRAANEARPVLIRTSMGNDGGRKHQVSIRVSKLQDDLFLIVFMEKTSPPADGAAVSIEAECIAEPAVRQLESELSATRQELQSSIEQLKSLNEELQSSNEELQAANEELETSREELQSLNEELMTVNTQLQTKVEEQEETNNDLHNFLTSTNIPTIFLDHSFRVKRFTPAITKLIKLIPSDIGRPIADMSQEGLGPDLLADAQSVLDNLTPVKREIRLNSTWHVRTALPYRTFDNRIEGVIITYNNVTELMQAEERSRHLASFAQLNPNPVIEIDSSAEVTFANPAASKALEELGLDKTDASLFLPADIEGILRDLEKKEESTLYREVAIRDTIFGATVQLIPRSNVVRVYAFDITQRKRAEEEIVRANEKWEQTFDTLPDLIAIMDCEHRITRVNRSMAERLGLSPEQCIGLRCHEAVHGLGEVPVFCPHTMTCLDGVEHVEEVHEPRLGGDFLVSTTPRFDSQGQLVGTVHVARDITERKRTEEALRQGEARLKRSQEIAHLGSWELDLVRNELAWSDEVYRIFGLEPQEFGATYEAFLERVHPDDRAAVDSAYSDSVREGRDDYEIEHRVVRKGTGEIRWVHEKCQHFRDAGGNIIRSVGMVHDITERKQAEEWISRHVMIMGGINRIFRAALTANTEEELGQACLKVAEQITKSKFGFIGEIGPDGLMQDTAISETGWELCAMFDKTGHRRLPGKFAIHGLYGRVLVDGKGFYTNDPSACPDSIGTPEGHPGLKSFLGVPMLQDGKTIGMVGMGNREGGYGQEDLEALESLAVVVVQAFMRMRAETALQQAHAELEVKVRERTAELARSNAELEQFAYVASHDLQEPLRMIGSYMQLLEMRYKGRLDEAADKYIHFAVDGAKRMQGMITGLLQYSRVETRALPLTPVDCNLALRHALDHLKALISQSDAAITSDFLPTVTADETQILYLFQNLLKNSIKFRGAAPPEIHVSAKRSDGEWLFSVRDNGIGISEEFSERIFDIFERLHGYRYEGTGIGLAICKRIIERHGGRIWVESEPEKGSTFFFTIPDKEIKS